MSSAWQFDIRVTVTAPPRHGPYEPGTASAMTVSTGATQWSKTRWCEVCGYPLNRYNQYTTCGVCYSICERYHQGIRAGWANSASAAAPAAAAPPATANGRPDALEEAQILAAAAAAVKESNSQS